MVLNVVGAALFIVVTATVLLTIIFTVEAALLRLLYWCCRLCDRTFGGNSVGWYRRTQQ